MPLEPGAVIDRYVIESLLGAGGMGEVYRARDPRLQRSVALKVLRDVPDESGGSNQSAGGAERLLREARAAAALEHANVVAVYDVGHVEAPGGGTGVTYLAMELIKGSSLRAYVGDARIPIAERLRWLTDIARALAAAHRAGLVHRDVKPENVMIREDGAVKVLDFGIARRAGGVTNPASSVASQALSTMAGRGVIVGTPQYMAPEQLRAEQLDGRADQFAWGVVAWELLAGRSPWAVEEGAIAMVARILSRDPPAIDTLAPVPEHVGQTIARALRKEASARFGSMDVLIEALAGNVDPLAAPRSLAPPSGPPTTNPLAATQRAPSGKGVDFASAPTEAILTPLPRRGPPAADSAIAAPAPRLPRWIMLGAALVVAGAAVGGATLRLRGPRRTDSAEASIVGHPPECTSNKACIDAHGGDAWICRAEDHRCAALGAEDCLPVAEPGDVDLDSTVWLGTLFPLTGEGKDTFRAYAQATELARRDFAETLGRIGTARHVGILSCDSAADIRRAARHLADDIHVPAVVIGTTREADIIEVVAKILAPRDVLAMVPLSASPLVTAVPAGPSGRLVYRSTYSSDHLLAPTAAFVGSVLEPQQSRGRAGKPLRLAFLHEKGLERSVFYDRLLTVLRLNGKSMIDNGDDFRDVAYDDGAASYASALDELARFKPNLVLTRISSGAVRGVIVPLEQGWPAAAPRPTYLFSMPLLRDVLVYIGGDPSRRRRFFGMDNVATTAINAQLLNHYNQTFGEHLSRVRAPATSFDAFYALAYAVHAVGAGPVTGPALAAAFRRLARPGNVYPVGPQSIFDAYKDLLSGASIDLEGASGHLDLNEATGESTFGIAIQCAAPPEGEAAARAIESGLVYEEGERGFVGTLACP